MKNSKASKTITLTGTHKPFLGRDETLNMYYNDIRKYAVLSQEETIGLFKLYQNGTKEEKEFLDEFESGEYIPELLFEDKDILNRIKNHPMALWKTRSV